MAKPKENADSDFLTGLGAIGPTLYEQSFKTITKNKFICCLFLVMGLPRDQFISNCDACVRSMMPLV